MDHLVAYTPSHCSCFFAYFIWTPSGEAAKRARAAQLFFSLSRSLYLCVSLVMPRPLSEEVDDAVRELECIKAALSSTGEDGQSYLGMRGHVQAERLALLQLLHLSLSTVDRLREKEIEVLKASTAAAAAAGQCTRVGKKSPQRPVTSRACRYKIVIKS